MLAFVYDKDEEVKAHETYLQVFNSLEPTIEK